MSYLGQVLEIPLGPDGFTGNKNATQVQPGQLIEANNVSYADGTLAREGGTTVYGGPIKGSTVTVLGGWDWWPTPILQRMVNLISSGFLMKDDGTAAWATTLASGLTTTSVNPVFVEGGKEAAANNRKLFVFTGLNPVQVLSGDGATTAAIASPPADWATTNQPLCGAVHQDLLWGFGNANDPHRGYYSTRVSHEDFVGSGAGTIAIFPGEGERIVDCLSYKGLLIVWKYPRGIYLIDTTDASPANWRVTRLSSSIGGVSPNGHAMIDGDVIFMDPLGDFHLISAITEFGNLGTRSLSSLWTLEPWTRSHINPLALSVSKLVYYAARREVQAAVAGGGSLINTLRVVIDGNRPQFPRVRISDRDICPALWMRRDSTGVPRPLIGGTDGIVRHLDQSTRIGYVSTFQTGHLDFGHIDPVLATKRKNGQFLEMVYEGRNGSLTVDVFWDGKHAQTIAFPMGGGGGAVLGSTFILGSAVLGGSGLHTARPRMVGSGRRLSIKGSASASGHDFSLARAYAHVGIGDERRSP